MYRKNQGYWNSGRVLLHYIFLLIFELQLYAGNKCTIMYSEVNKAQVQKRRREKFPVPVPEEKSASSKEETATMVTEPSKGSSENTEEETLSHPLRSRLWSRCSLHNPQNPIPVNCPVKASLFESARFPQSAFLMRPGQCQRLHANPSPFCCAVSTLQSLSSSSSWVLWEHSLLDRHFPLCHCLSGTL